MTPPHVLVVDDQPRMAQSLCRILSMPEGGGYLTSSCESAEEAIERIRENHFDLVVTDLRMSGLSGLDLLQQARELSPATRRILVTGYDAPQTRDAASELADAYIVKPLSPREFVETVRELIGTGAAADAVAASQDGDREAASVERRCEQFRQDVGAVGVFMVDASGQVTAQCGGWGGLEPRLWLPALARGMPALNEVDALLQNEKAFSSALHQGDSHEIYTARVTDSLVLCAVLDRTRDTRTSTGVVWLSLRRTISDIVGLLGGSLIVTAPPSPPEAEPRVRPHGPPASMPVPRIESRENQPPPQEPPDDGPPLLTFEQARALGLIDLDHVPAGPQRSGRKSAWRASGRGQTPRG